MFVRRPLIEQNPFAFQTQHDFGYDNLVVSGCSFTYNNSSEHACTWPYYLKDLGKFKAVYDCSLPGAGNYHISHSLKWALTLENLDPTKTLVVVMWSGNDRDDLICGADFLNSYPTKHLYQTDVASAVTGGSAEKSIGNVDDVFGNIKRIKTRKSRSIENYLYIDSLKTWLDQNNYSSVFLDYLDRNLPNLTRDFDIRDYLPNECLSRLDEIIIECEDIYSFALKNDLLWDDFHPTPDGHLEWTKQYLVPLLQKLNI